MRRGLVGASVGLIAGAVFGFPALMVAALGSADALWIGVCLLVGLPAVGFAIGRSCGARGANTEPHDTHEITAQGEDLYVCTGCPFSASDYRSALAHLEASRIASRAGPPGASSH